MDGSALIWDVSVSPVDQFKAEPRDQRFYQDRWDRLATKDGSDAFEAMCELARAPHATVKFFKEQLSAPARAEIGQLVAQLDSDDFKVRERASAELERLGEPAVDVLRQVIASQPTAEVRRRAQAILDRFDTGKLRYRRLRSLELLEHLGTAEARELLESIAKGAPESQLTQEAKASLDRLSKRRGDR